MDKNVQALQEQMLHVLDMDNVDYMADEIAEQTPSPSQVSRLPISNRAKELRRNLLQALEASGGLEEAREVLLEFAEALEEVSDVS